MDRGGERPRACVGRDEDEASAFGAAAEHVEEDRVPRQGRARRDDEHGVLAGLERGETARRIEHGRLGPEVDHGARDRRRRDGH